MRVMLVRRLFRIILLSGFAVFAFVLGAPAVYADGDDFFAFQLGNNKDDTNVFTGNVKDDQGKYLSGATLTIVITAPSIDELDDTPIDLTFKTFTNFMGRYRTLNADDMASVFSGDAVTVKREDIKLVGVSKAGYTQIRRIDRSRPGRPIREIDFIMKKVDK